MPVTGVTTLDATISKPFVRDAEHGYTSAVDPFLAQDIEASRQASPGEKLLQALDLMQLGIEMKEQQLRAKHPELTEEQLEVKLQLWLARNE